MILLKNTLQQNNVLFLIFISGVLNILMDELIEYFPHCIPWYLYLNISSYDFFINSEDKLNNFTNPILE